MSAGYAVVAPAGLPNEPASRGFCDCSPSKSRGRYAAVLLLIVMWGLIFMFFGTKKPSDITAMQIVCAVVAAASVVGASAAALGKNDLILLGILVHVAIFAGVLTLQHCVVYSAPQEMHPDDLAAIPEHLRNNMTTAGTNALVCFSKRANVENFNKFLAGELKDVGMKMHRWGFAFSSAFSPLVPLSLGVVNYWILWDRSIVAWDLLTILALDIVDCMTMFDTIFAHDPYFLFEDVDHAFMWIFVGCLYFFWNVATFQFSAEMKLRSQPGSGEGANNMPGITSWLLNLVFLLLRLALRAKAMFCVPVLILKNIFLLVDIPLEVVRQKDRAAGGAYQGLIPNTTNPDVTIDTVKVRMTLIKRIICEFKIGIDKQSYVEKDRLQFDKVWTAINKLEEKYDAILRDDFQKLANNPTYLPAEKIAQEQELMKTLRQVHKDVNDIGDRFKGVDNMLIDFRTEVDRISNVDVFFRNIEDMLYNIKDQARLQL